MSRLLPHLMLLTICCGSAAVRADVVSPPVESRPAPAVQAPALAAPVPDKKEIAPPAVSIPASPVPATNHNEAFSRAVNAYQAGSYEEARRDFLAIVEAGQFSASLAHNLGNIEFRRGDLGQAVLWYKRALAVQPFSPETLQNLRTVRRQTAFLTFDPWGLSFAHLKPAWIKNGTALAAWGLGLAIVWLAWLTPRRGLRWPLVVLAVLLLPVLALGSLLTWKLRTNPYPLERRQVVSNKETNAYAAPAEASSSVISLPAGTEVVPLETRGNWLYCIIPSGDDDQPLRGWIRAAKLEPLWPWPAKI